MEDYQKKYETAIKQAKEELKTCGSLDCDAARQIFRFFPELRELKDKRIRKEILSFLKEFEHDHYRNLDFSSWIAWLEKQGNKLHEEKVDEAMREIEEKVRAFSNKHKGESSDEILAQMRGEQKPVDKGEPKWKKGNDGEFLYETSIVWLHNETKTLATAGLLLDSNTFYIPISELEKLPKEEVEEKPTDKIEPKFHEGEWITIKK